MRILESGTLWLGHTRMSELMGGLGVEKEGWLSWTTSASDSQQPAERGLMWGLHRAWSRGHPASPTAGRARTHTHRIASHRTRIPVQDAYTTYKSALQAWAAGPDVHSFGVWIELDVVRILSSSFSVSLPLMQAVRFSHPPGALCL